MFGDLSTLIQQYQGGLAPAMTAGSLAFLVEHPGLHHHQELMTQLRGGSSEAQERPWFEDIFEDASHHPATVDYSDNNKQAQVIKHHYMNEFGHHISLSEVLKDYADNVIIHEVVDNVPKTYRGREGVRRAFRDMYRKIPHDTTHFEFEYIAIDHNHAQTVWKAVIPRPTGNDIVIQGMDSFAFDKENRITHQSTMAISNDKST